jgi:hypothetical protein
MSNLEVFSYYLRKNQFNFNEFMRDQDLIRKMNLPKEESQYVKSVHKLENKVKQLNAKKLFQRPNLMD